MIFLTQAIFDADFESAIIFAKIRRFGGRKSENSIFGLSKSDFGLLEANLGETHSQSKLSVKSCTSQKNFRSVANLFKLGFLKKKDKM